MGSPAPHPEPKLVTKLKARKETHREKGRIYRAAFVVAGVTLLLAGTAMLVLPGPAFVVIPIGLALLALEFTWAENLLDRSLVEADKAKRKAQETTRNQRILSAIAVACGVAAFVVVAVLYDIPVLPV
jgi:uncharacterized protein (TIGR02611 family)